MPSYLMLRNPSANRVYAGSSGALGSAELRLSLPHVTDVRDVTVAGVGYLAFDAPPPSDSDLVALAGQSSAFALFQDEGELLLPIAMPESDWLDDDLVTIPKYQGKTNEQFTRLLLNVTLAAVTRPANGHRQVLDPMAGRGTTLSTAWLAGHDAHGVEIDTKAFEQMVAFYKTWLRRKRLKHTANVTPVRRDGRTVGKRFDATVNARDEKLAMTVFTGDTRSSAELFGKKKFDAVVVDAPYGVVHGSTSDVRGATGKRDRTPAGLLGQAVDVWAGQLMHGGALGISWNTLSLPREELVELVAGAGLDVQAGGAWEEFAHRVDSSIRRDVLVATKP